MKLPSFWYEKKIWKKGYKTVAGTDEVGRGCFAGPVIAAAVVFSSTLNTKYEIPDTVVIDDSKRMRPKEREKSADWIKKNALGWGIGEVPVSDINRLGMAKATKKAFRRAVSAVRKRLNKRIDYLLIDAFFIPYIPGLPTRRKKTRRQLPIVDGDQKSISIASASIIAKVYRDKLMTSLSKQSTRNAAIQYKVYGWGRNKGYGTKEHQRAILRYGITRYHRKVFVKTFLANSKLKANI